MARDRVAPALRLSVQYATARPTPARDRVRRWVRAAIAVLDGPDRSYALTVRFVDEDEARALNRTYRGKDYATNVLTFPYPAEDARIEGDVVVCMPVVESEARRQEKDAMAHCAHLVVHGVLHAAGRDHQSAPEAGAMEAIERAALARFRIADPYAVRT
jgi:probable rRNA maturation factor